MFKNIKPVLGGLLCLAIISCKKDIVKEKGSTTDAASANAAAESYYPYINGASFTYVDSTTGGESATVRSTVNIAGDTTMDGKIFSKTTVGNAASFYNAAEGVTTLVSFNGEDKITTTVLKANEPVGAVWKDEFFNAGVPSTYEWKMVAKGIIKTVQGVTYSNVIQVHLDGYASLGDKGKLVFAYSDYFYAPNIGLIANTSYDAKTGDITFQRGLRKSL